MRNYLRSPIIMLLVVVMVMVIITPAMAGWSGSQTFTWELDEEFGVVATQITALGYALADQWLVTIVVDNHPRLGTDIDASSTLYPIFRLVNYRRP